jgi:DMSO/TMAO reductase YedYZ molybdopterin-dependent catalytic subunit
MPLKDKLPPGQHAVTKMVAMPPIGGSHPHIDKKDWRLRVCGEVENEIIWNWEEFNKLTQKDFVVDFHCVTHWSKLDQPFFGVEFSDVLRIVKPKPKAKFVIFESADGYTSNVVLKELKENFAFIATKMNGVEIEDKFGGPARVVIPHLYAWKSTKYLTAIRFQEKDEPGFWETRGYNNHGDPWKEERYS